MELVHIYLNEFIKVFTLTIIIIITPGPDFFIVVKNSISISRKAGILTSIGVATGVWVHIAYSLLGIAVIISKSVILFKVIKFLGLSYLIFIGISCIRNNRKETFNMDNNINKQSNFNSYKNGLFNNILNPKATIFFLSLFTQVVDIKTPLSIKIAYGSIVSIVCFIWFSFVAILLNNRKLKEYFIKNQYIVEKVMGSILILYAIKLAITNG